MLDLADKAVATEPSFAAVADALSLGLPYRALVSPDGRKLRFLAIGARCREMLGVSAEAVLADPAALINLMRPEDQTRMLEVAVGPSAEGRPFSIEVRMIGPGGELRWRRFVAAPRFRQDGGYEWDGLITDVTESRRMAEALETERRRLEEVIEIAGMGVYHWDSRDPERLTVSDRWLAIYGLAPGSPLRLEMLRNMVHPEDWELVRARAFSCNGNANPRDHNFEHRVIRPDGEIRWVRHHQRGQVDEAGVPSLEGVVFDITALRNAEERRRLQMRELAHRGKNAVAVLAAMVQQAARGAGSTDELVQVLMARIDAMARSQDLATEFDGRPLPLAALLHQTLEVFDISRFELDPAIDALTVPGDATISLSLLLHELATNALKYGALSNREGRVRLSNLQAGEGLLAFEWREAGGPEVVTPTRQGFGMRLLGAVLRAAGGSVEPAFAPDGFCARIEMAVRRRSS